MFNSVHSPRLRRINITGSILSALFGVPILAIMWNFVLVETFTPAEGKWCRVQIDAGNLYEISKYRLSNAYFEILTEDDVPEGTFAVRRKLHVVPMGPWSFKECPADTQPLI